MSEQKSTNFNFNILGGQSNITQKITLTQTGDDAEITSGLNEMIENATMMEGTLNLSPETLREFQGTLREVSELAKTSPLPKEAAKAKLNSLSTLLEKSASGMSVVGLVAMINTLVTALG